MSGEALTIRVYLPTKARRGAVVAFLNTKPVATITITADEAKRLDVDLAVRMASAAAGVWANVLW